jgi:hypothetical protein
MENEKLAAYALIGFGAVAVTAGLIVGNILWDGYVLMVLWGWFMVPIFHLPMLAIAQSIGLACVVNLVTHQYIPSKKDDTWAPVAHAFIAPLMLFIVGWLVK